MSQNLITLIGVVDSLSFVIRDFNNELPAKDEVLGRLGNLKKELLETRLRQASVALSAERTLEAAISGIYPAFCQHPEVQVFLSGLREVLLAEVLPPPLPSCSSSKKVVS